MPIKTCFKCNVEKELSQFYAHKRMSDGHLNKCKECAKNDVTLRYRDPESHKRIVQYEKKRFNDPRRKKLLLEYQRNSRANDKTKHKARTMVGNAIRDGRLIRLPCEVCGDTKSQAHHPDYRRPLHVKWLCFKHHREEHGQTVTQQNEIQA